MKIETTNFKNVKSILPKYILPQIDKLLVLGCGEMINEIYLNAKYILGIDWADQQLDIAKNISNVIVIKYDIRNIGNILRDKSFDSVAMFDFLEHLTKEDAINLLTKLEQKINKQIILFVPIQKEIKDIAWEIERQEELKKQNLSMGHHLSLWSPKELDDLGFRGEYSENHHPDKNMGAVFCVKNIK